jgi:hypothetical protein
MDRTQACASRTRGAPPGVAAIFRVVEMTKPTLLMDEADTFFHDNDELRGILNAGHRKGGCVLRCEGDDLEPRMFSTWAPAAIAAIGELPDTLVQSPPDAPPQAQREGQVVPHRPD